MKRRIGYSLVGLLAALLLAWFILLHSTWGLALALRIAGGFVPGTLTIEETSGSLSSPLTLHGVRYEQDGLRVSLASVTLTWQVYALLDGRLVINALSLSDVGLELPKAEATSTAQPIAFSLPLAVTVEQAEVTRLSVQTADAAAPVLLERINLSARSEAQVIQLQDLRIVAFSTELHSKGQVTLADKFPLQLQLGFSYPMPQGSVVQGSGTLHGNLQKLQLHQALSGPVQADVDLTLLGLDHAPSWQGEVQIKAFNPVQLDATWPDMSIQGHLRPQGDLQQFRLEGNIQVDDTQRGRTELTLSGQGEYTLQDYQFNVLGEFIGIDLPPAKYQISGQGTMSALHITKLDAQTLHGDVRGTAKLAWQPHLTVEADLALRNLETQFFDRQWPGKLDANLTVRSTQANKTTRISFALQDLRGVLRDYPLRGDAEGSWHNEVLELAEMRLTIGESHIRAQGKLDTHWDLNFQVQAPDLRQLLPDAAGIVNLQGQLRGLRNAPAVQAQGEATQLRYAEHNAAAVRFTADLGLTAGDRFTLSLQAEDVESTSGHWQSIELTAQGTADAHELNFAAVNAQAAIHMQARGALSIWQWRGVVPALELSYAELGTWRLRAPARLHIEAAHISLSSACLEQDVAYLCTELDWRPQQPTAVMDGRNVPAQLLNFWLPGNIAAHGPLHLQGRLQGRDQAHVTASLSVMTDAEEVYIDFVEVKERLTLGASSIVLSLDKKGLHGQLQTPFMQAGGINAQFGLPDWNLLDGLPGNQTVHARLNLERLPADVITRFIPDMARAQGYLVAALEFGGTLGEPRLSGTAQWQEGNMLIPVLGISINQISAELESEKTNTVKFSIRARSGAGQFQLTGQTLLDSVQGWPTTAHLQANNLEVINIIEAYILVDADINISLQGHTIELSGDVKVPLARLRPRELPEGTAALSRDVVIISEQDTRAAQPNWLVTSRIRVQLGELVEFDGFDVTGKLRGTLLIIDEPGRPIVGQGEVRIEEGSYRLRGQDLKIRRGRLIFANSFIDNPGIDVEATRSIEEVLVGVRLKGTLKDPTLTIFSEPAMAETDALSYLILGHALTQGTAAEGESIRNTAAAMGFVAGDLLAREIGGRLGLDELRVDVGETTQQTSLVMGKYLSSKLYLRYLTGIVESSNIVQLRYQLSRRIQIQTEGGYRGSQSVTGGDIFFTVEY